MSPALPDNIRLNKKLAGGMAYKRKRKGGVSVISLITDFGQNDNFVGVIKGVILSINPNAKIVDICHEVKPHDILTGAFLLKSSFKYFPKGSLHLVVVDPGVGSERKNLLVKTKDYFFIAPDNGVLSPALKGQVSLKIIEITNKNYFLKPTSDTFHGRDIFAPTVAYLSKGEDFSKFGKRIKSIKELRLPQVKITSKDLIGEIIYIDRFGNLVSNIDKEMLDNFIKDKKFRIYIKDKTIEKLSHSYSEGTYLKPLALIDSFNYLEIALNWGSACNYLKAKKGAEVMLAVT